MQKIFITNNKKETWDLIPEILNNLKDRNIVLLKGELGSGKTTLAQGILKFLGARGPFTSPTFVIMKCYTLNLKFKNQNSKLQLKTKNQKNPFSLKSKILNLKSIFHLDCYRVGAKDMLELGWEEIVKDKNNLVLVEWPEKINSILPEKYLEVELEIKGRMREIKILKN